ncbi:MAG TPA: peptide ABC transporter substrate-binding protein [Anaerolineae bacterium]|nr:peptide ABC transporter substrate-binding protein [Anaerolineae bacterium]
MSENRGLIAVVVVLLVALVGLVCVGLGALIYCPQPGSICSGFFGATTTANQNTPSTSPTAVGNQNQSQNQNQNQGQNQNPQPSQGNTAPVGNTLRLPGGSGAGGDPPTLDPAQTSDVESATYIVEIFSGLVSFNKDLKIVPELAEKWDVSNEGKTYTFTLRKDAKFHDGRPVTAQDVKYSLERAADPKTRSTVSPLYLGDIVGFMDKYTGKAQDISGVKVIDNYTVQIDIKAPVTYFLAELAHPTSYVVDKFNVESGDQPWYLKPNGTGPYKLVSWDQGQQIVLEKNPDYYGDPKPSVDRVEYLLGGGSPMTRYENGDLDAVAVSLADIERVSDTNSPLNKELQVVPQLSTSFLVFNTRKPPFDDPKVRLAFAMSIDKNKIVDVVYKKMAEPAKGILPESFPGYNPNQQGIPYDPEGAKKLLAESKYANGLPDIVWNTVGGGGTAAPSTQAIAEMLKDNLGANISIEQTDWATYLSEISGTNVDFQMFDIGWSADYVDPENFFGILFRSDSLNNWSGYNNPEVDKLIDQASLESDLEKRINLYQQAEDLILKDAPVLPLTYGRDYWLTKPYVKGVFYPPLVVERLKYITLEK